jgi:streptogramin lyase
MLLRTDVVGVRPGVLRAALAALLAAAAAVLVLAGPAQAAPTITEYTTGLTANLSPMQAAKGPDGNVWFTQNSATGAIGQVTSAGNISEFTSGLVANGTPRGIAAGPDGNLWFTQPGGPRIGKMTTGGTVTAEYGGLPAGSSPQGITAGPDGNLWFTDTGNGGAIGKITTSGAITEYSAGLTANSNPWNIVTGPDGNLWFTEHASTKIGRITPATGSISEYTGLTGAADDITSGPDGNLWFTENANPGRIGRVTTAGLVTEYTTGLTSNSGPQDITLGGDGRVYFTESQLTAVGAITTGGTITEYSSGLTAASIPWGITPGADGGVWFTESANPGRVGELTVPPAATTGVASNIGASSATLAGSVTPNSQATTYYFRYGISTSYGSQTGTSSLAASGSAQSVSAALGGLSPSTLYHYQLVATNGAGTAYGSDQTFTTSAASGSGSSGSGSSNSPSSGSSGASPLTSSVGPQSLRGHDTIAAAATVPAVLGQTVVATTARGQVTVQRPAAPAFVPLTGATTLPVGSVIDTHQGAVTIVTALPGRRRQSATFWGGTFSIRQAKSGMTDIFLTGGDFSACGRTPHTKSTRAAIARSHRSRSATRGRSRKVIRQLWAKDHHGLFTTHGLDSTSTVRGTYWLTQDRCDGTLTRVRQGTVAVKNLKTGRHTLVRAGHQQLARSRR